MEDVTCHPPPAPTYHPTPKLFCCMRQVDSGAVAGVDCGGVACMLPLGEEHYLPTRHFFSLCSSVPLPSILLFYFCFCAPFQLACTARALFCGAQNCARVFHRDQKRDAMPCWFSTSLPPLLPMTFNIPGTSQHLAASSPNNLYKFLHLCAFVPFLPCAWRFACFCWDGTGRAFAYKRRRHLSSNVHGNSRLSSSPI